MSSTLLFEFKFDQSHQLGRKNKNNLLCATYEQPTQSVCFLHAVVRVVPHSTASRPFDSAAAAAAAVVGLRISDIY